GTDTLTVVADDLGNTGANGPLTASNTVSIRVLSPTQQIADLKTTVKDLSAQKAINKLESLVLLATLDIADAAMTKGKPKVAAVAIAAFGVEIRLLVATRSLTAAQGQPLLSATDSLLKSLLTA